MRPFGDAPRRALEQFIAAVPASDHIAVSSLTSLGLLHQDRPTLYRQLAELPASESSRVWMGMQRAAEALTGVECRRAVIMATDGRDSFQALTGRLGQKTAGIALRDRVAQLYVIAPQGQITREVWRVAEESGGRVLPLLHSDQLNAIWSEITTELRHQYLLSYAPPEHDGRVHNIKVVIRKTGFTVRSRRTYLAPGA